MTAKHTPGPWRVGRPKRILDMDARGAVYIHGKDVTIASVLDGEREANAKLLAAAPDGFEAAENTIAYYAVTEPGRSCLADELNPCGGLRHWGGSIGCPLCSARAFLVKATKG
jgi:hypothetical protein